MATESEPDPGTDTSRWRLAAVAASTGLADTVRAYRYASVPEAGGYAAAAAAGLLVACLVSLGRWSRAR